jgi:hypothetical protein
MNTFNPFNNEPTIMNTNNEFDDWLNLNESFFYVTVDQDGDCYAHVQIPTICEYENKYFWVSKNSKNLYLAQENKFIKNFPNYTGNWKLSLLERPIVNIKKLPFVFDWFYANGTSVDLSFSWFTIDCYGNGFVHKRKPKYKFKKNVWLSKKDCYFVGKFDATDWQNSRIQRKISTTESSIATDSKHATNCKLFAMSEFYQSLTYKTAFKKYFNNS